MDELDIAAITKRSIQGVFAFVSRTLFIQIINFVVNILLTIYLSPLVFGVYFLVTAVIAFLQYFSDIGLAAALIQKKEQLTKEDLATTFTIQQVLVITAVVFALLISPWVGTFYHLNKAGTYLLQALIISFFLSSLKTIPSVLLERNLRFEKLVIPQIVETLFFNLTALLFAIKGFGVMSFAYAVLARGASGLITMYFISPWMPRIGFSKAVAKRLLSFGIPFQLNSFLALIKDDLFIAYIGKVLPLTQVGYIGFAQKWAFTPLRLIMDNIIRITFPSFSRLQHEKELLGKAVEKSLFVLALLVFPSLVGLVSLAPLFLQVIPKYQKWEPALVSLLFFAISAAFASISTPLTNALNAIGKIKTTLYFMVFWTIATWFLTPITIFMYGFNGVAIAAAVISLSSVAVLYVAKKYVDFHIFKIVTVPLIGSAVMGFVLYLIQPYLPQTLLTILILIILGGLLYLGIVLLFAKDEVITDLKTIKRQLLR